MSAWLKDVLDAIDGDERFVMTLGAGIVNTALVACGVIAGGEYVTLTLGTVAVFIGASAYSSGVEMRTGASVTINRDHEDGRTDRA